MTNPVSYPNRLRALAGAHPDRTAIHFVPPHDDPETLTWAELDRRSTQVARRLEGDVDRGDLVALIAPSSPAHHIVAHAIWKLGACFLPLPPGAPPHERSGLVELAEPAVTLAHDDGSLERCLAQAEAESPNPLPDVTSRPGRALPSGGSTGRPKLIVDSGAWARVPGDLSGPVAAAGLRPGQIQLVAAPLYHNTAFTWSHIGLFERHTLIVMERFDAAAAVELIRRHGVEFVAMVPTMMQRIARLDPDEAAFETLETLLHTAAACPAWVKRWWIDRLSPERVIEGYGATDYLGACVIRGHEWLEHEGSVGRPVDCDVRILDAHRRPLPPGRTGEIFLRLHGGRQAFTYLGAPPLERTADGFASVGDLGYLDDDGYLYLSARRDDLIVSGGVNVYPAEVEAAITAHPAVADAVVLGQEDDEWGEAVVAVVEPAEPTAPPSSEELGRHCREHLARQKCPRHYHFVDALPRTATGKIRRGELAACLLRGPS